jgi:GAF domain-containing protein/HAMP domain-containing protein
MMRALSLRNWSIPVKIAVLVGLAVLILTFPSFIAVRTATLESGRDSALRYVQLNGAQRQTAVGEFLSRAQGTLDTFMQNEEQRQVALSLLLLNDTNLPSNISAQDVNALFSTLLLDPATTVFDYVRLIDENGIVLAASTPNEPDFTPVIGTSQSRTDSFLAGVAAFVGGSNNALVPVEVADLPSIELVNAIQRRSGELAGFLVARISRAALQTTLRTASPDYPINTYIVAQPDFLLAPASLPEGATTPELGEGGVRALTGQTAIDQYTLTDGTPVMGYYAPLANGQLGFISEVSLAAVEAQSFAYFTARSFVLAIGFAALVGLVIALLTILNQQIAPPIARLRKVTQALGQGDFAQPVPDSARGDELGALAASFVVMRDQVNALVNELQARLEARARDIDTTQEISRFAATQQDLQSLMDRVVNLITERFDNIYHAQIFLVDSENKTALLRASTGEAGQILLARGHRLDVGSVSVIGQVTGQKRVVIARDTSYSEVHRKNELLPDTRAELAIPLFFGDTVIGALDVQSKQRDSFTPDEVNVLQTVANQVAVAIRTAQLYEESLKRLSQIENANRLATARAWQDYMRDQRSRELSSRAGVVSDADLSELRRVALTTGQPALGEVTPRQTVPVAVPIQLAGQTIGAVEWNCRWRTSVKTSCNSPANWRAVLPSVSTMRVCSKRAAAPPSANASSIRLRRA